jgi:hypothetical protein
MGDVWAAAAMTVLTPSVASNHSAWRSLRGQSLTERRRIHMDTIIAEQPNRDRYAGLASEGRGETEGSLRNKDILAGILAAVMTLGPLAVTALFAH